MDNQAEAINNNPPEENCKFQQLFPKDAITNITTGVLSTYQPPLVKTKKQLDELLLKQEVLLEQIHDEQLKVSWMQSSVDLQKVFDTVGIYQKKLVGIKKDMQQLHDKNINLKKRVLRLQQHKQKLEHIQNEQKNLKKQQELVGSTSIQ